MRCRIIHSLHTALSPSSSSSPNEITAPYLLEQDVNEPDPEILSLNAELVACDETAARHLRERELAFLRTGLGCLVDRYLVSHARRGTVAPMNARGCGRMQLNILVLQQNLKNVEDGVDLARAANYFDLFTRGVDAVLQKARDQQGKEGDSGWFSYDELKGLVELCYSEQLADRERGVVDAARRQMAETLRALGEIVGSEDEGVGS
jgi:exocyst complex component 4